jgi:hypothetical protein
VKGQSINLLQKPDSVGKRFRVAHHFDLSASAIHDNLDTLHSGFGSRIVKDLLTIHSSSLDPSCDASGRVNG